MSDDELIAWHPDDFEQARQHLREARTVTRPEKTSGKGKARYHGTARVIIIDESQPVYSPRDVREVAIFRHNPDGIQKTVEMVGENLEGDLVLTIAGVNYQVPCDATTEEIRAIVTIPLQDCRITAFFGYWEFDFNFGRWSKAAPGFDIEMFEPPEDDDETPVYDGGLIVTDEGWVSVADDGDTYKTIETNDWVPFITGAVKRGSIGLCHWDHAAGWMAGSWMCREISFAEDPY